jgi:predicted component of type VI protein secretion system
MEVNLIVVGGKQAGKSIPAPGPQFVIGRGEECQLRPQSHSVSRRHCAIVVGEGSVTVQDFSSNGTFVNDERVQGEREVKTGDHLKVGPLEFELQLSVPVGGKKKPKVHSIQEAAARLVQNAGGEKDLDISNWLDEDEEEEEEPAWGSATVSAPSGGPAAKGPGEASSQAPATPEEQPEEKKEEPPTKIVGQFQRDKKPMAASSGEAAADVLRRLFDRKP